MIFEHIVQSKIKAFGDQYHINLMFADRHFLNCLTVFSSFFGIFTVFSNKTRFLFGTKFMNQNVDFEDTKSCWTMWRSNVNETLNVDITEFNWIPTFDFRVRWYYQISQNFQDFHLFSNENQTNQLNKNRLSKMNQLPSTYNSVQNCLLVRTYVLLKMTAHEEAEYN